MAGLVRIYRVRHIKCYRAIALKLLITSKNVSDKSFSDREGRHTRSPYFLSVEALKLRQDAVGFAESLRILAVKRVSKKYGPMM